MVTFVAGFSRATVSLELSSAAPPALRSTAASLPTPIRARYHPLCPPRRLDFVHTVPLPFPDPARLANVTRENRNHRRYRTPPGPTCKVQ